MTKNVIFILMIAMLFACNNVKQQHSDGGANETKEEEVKPKNEEVIANINNKTRQYLTADLNKDGKQDSLFLSVKAELDSKGRIAWDDANIWQVYVNINDQLASLYKESIQLGKIEVSYNRNSNLIYIIEQAPYQKRKLEIDPSKKFAITEVKEIPNVASNEVLKIDAD